MAFYRREASHAGSWYTDNDSYLNNVNNKEEKYYDDVRAVIAPHAGFSYSGPTAAYSYKALQLMGQRGKVKRVFVLGPCHHHYTRKCLVSGANIYETPVGDIKIDTATVNDLLKNKLFEKNSQDVDEDEHSVEMQLPFIAHTLKGVDFTLIPIMVGNIGADVHKFGLALAPYLANNDNFFIISSDFCHWGRRFQYSPYSPDAGPIWKYIQALDYRGIAAIEAQNLEAFSSYLRKEENTICGRNPIQILLCAMKILIQNGTCEFRTRLVKYDQSSHCESMNDSSVSYASIVVNNIIKK